ncbi:MAG TPA: antibiotic biosynthesis monooxygenase [Fimbriimonadaceae bacterium]|nr:antibiotic biosynthesis monooxygenase [Fimbriimonadaceae bacterium]
MTNAAALESLGPTRLAPGCCGLLQLCLPGFVAINTIQCQPEYVDRFKDLFQARAHAIDRIPGFLGMYVLSPTEEGGAHLVISHWVNQGAFDSWTGSEEFLEGHRRAFADMRAAKERGEAPPMKSEFATYNLLTT